MEKKKIEDLYNKKIKLLNQFNKFYYDLSKPKVSDQEYDKLKNEIVLLEKKYKFLKSTNSPTQKVGFKPSKNFKKLPHKVPMLSLSNVFSEEDLKNFEKKIINYLDKKDEFEIFYSAEPKIDGISASIIYKNGKFI